MNKDKYNNIHDEAEEPNVNVLEVSRLGEGGVNRGQESCHNKKAGQCAHEAVAEVCDIYVESKVSNDPKEERLEKSSGNNLQVEPFQSD